MSRHRYRWFALSFIALALCIYSPIYAQEATEEATPPVEVPTEAPTPTEVPTEPPTEAPTEIPTEPPTEPPTEAPTETPTMEATAEVTVEATVEVTEEATVVPTAPPVPTRELLVNFNPAATPQAVSDMLATLNGVELERIPQIGAMRVLVPDTVGTPGLAMARLQANPRALQAAGVLNVEYNGNRHLMGFTPNDPKFADGSQWGILDFDTNLPDGGPGSMWVHSTFGSGAWDIATARGMGVTVAVLDSGVDLTHPDLMANLVPGWDFVEDDNAPWDDLGHGTHVAGVIAARTNNGMGIAGIAFNAKIMPIKICTSGGACPLYDIAAGIVHAVDRNVKVINLSLGDCSGVSTTEQAAVEYALSRNVVVVAAGGNGTYTGGGPCATNPESYAYPASYPGVISVAAHDEAGASCGDNFGGLPGDGCNYNDRITVSAPGWDVYSTLLAGTYGLNSGTSMATPQVSGVAALFLSVPTMPKTVAAVREALICAANNPNNPGGRDDLYGYGMVQADMAMNWNANSATCQISLPNDNFETPTVINAVPYSATVAVNARSVTPQASDPDLTADPDCSAPAASPQTLWWRYRPAATGMYQITTFGSSFDTVLGVFTGNQGALTKVGCNDDSGVDLTNGESLLTVPLQAATTYYIMARQYDTPVNGEVLLLNVRLSATANNVDVQENSPFIHYSGTWARIPRTGASGGYVNQTSDDNALAIFSFRGPNVDIARTIGPDRGDMEVWIDGVETILNNRAAVTKANQVVNVSVGGNAGTWHQVILRRDAAGPAGAVDFDRFRPHEAAGVPTTVVTAWADDRAASLIYAGSWFGPAGNIMVTGSYLGTINESGFPSPSPGDTVTGRLRGTAIGIYRNTNAAFGPMDVYIDGQFYTTINNNSATGVQVPYWITGLVATDHVVRVENAVGNQIQFDAFFATASAPLALNSYIDDRNALLRYTGVWSNVNDTRARSGTLRSTTDTEARVDFLISGNHFCVEYHRNTGYGSVSVYVDNVLLDTFSTAGLEAFKVPWCSLDSNNPLTDGNHWVRLVPNDDGTVQLDSVRSLRYNLITPARGLVHDNDLSFTYGGDWNVYSSTALGVNSFGGYKVQGTTVHTAWADGFGCSSLPPQCDDETVTFYVNGSGFILYTTMGTIYIPPDLFYAGGYTVEVDGVPLSIYYGDTPYAEIDLWMGRTLFSPAGWGVTGLGPGIHKVVLLALTDDYAGAWVDFDGIRVFP